MTEPKAKASSADNHELLIKLTEHVSGLGSDVTRFMGEQKAENSRLHERIDEVSERHQKGIESIKDLMASRGRVTLAHVATVVSMLALVSGLLHAYVSMVIQPLTPKIEKLEARQEEAAMRELVEARATGRADAEREAMRRDLDRLSPKPNRPNHLVPRGTDNDN